MMNPETKKLVEIILRCVKMLLKLLEEWKKETEVK